MSTVKFYHALNCNRRIGWGPFAFDFRPYGMVCGTWCGLYATEDPSQQAALDALVADPRQAVSLTTQEDYEAKLGRVSADAARSYNPILIKPENLRGDALVAGSEAIVIEQPNPEPAHPAATIEPLSKALDALQVGPVTAGPK